MIKATIYQHNGVKMSTQLTIHDSQIFLIFDMEKFFEQCVEMYEALVKVKCAKASTPFIPEDKGVNPARTTQKGPGFVCPGCTECAGKRREIG